MTNFLDTTSDFISFGEAGFDAEFTLFKIYTRPLFDKKTGHEGTLDTYCHCVLAEFEAHADPVGLLKYLVRKYVVEASRSTGVPAERWVVEFSPIMERYNIPSHLFLDTGRDRAWLV